MIKPTRNMWISAGVAGVILAGGISVAAAATSGGLGDGRPSGTSTDAPGEAPGRIPGPDVPQNAEPTRSPEEFVVREDLDGDADPKKVAEFWTEKRLGDAEPLPIPVLTPDKPAKKD